MAYRVEFHPKALEDLERVIEFYSLKNVHAAQKIYTSFLVRFESHSQYPHRGRVVPEFLDEGISKYRELIEGHYRIVYRYTDKVVTIVRIVDSSALEDMQEDGK